MLFNEVFKATNYWWEERKELGVHHFIIRLIPFLFQTVESLYTQTRKLPLQPGRGALSHKIGGSYVITIGMFLPSEQYTTLRVVISLMGDIYHILTPLREKEQLIELAPLIQDLYDFSNKFRAVRNFFTHLDEVFTDMDEHGVSGASKTNCGIEYEPSARSCVHLIWEKNILHFTFQKNIYEITIDRFIFDPIFKATENIYSELISYKNGEDKKNYTPVEKLFPLK